MALKGNLRDFTVTQLLNLISLAQKTGTLQVKGSRQTAHISFRTGKLAYAQMDQSDSSLASILFRNGQLTRQQLGLIRSRAGSIDDKELGLLLINANYISQDEILESLKIEYTGVVNELFTWGEGLFLFHNDVLPRDGKIILKIALENLIIEGSRQMREMEHLQDEIPSLEMALKFSDRPSTNLRNINLSVEEWRVVSFINPKNSIQQIAKASKLNDLEIRRIVYSLLQAGLVELIHPEGQQITRYQKPTLPVSGKQEQKSLVNRLIKRIQSL